MVRPRKQPASVRAKRPHAGSAPARIVKTRASVTGMAAVMKNGGRQARHQAAAVSPGVRRGASGAFGSSAARTRLGMIVLRFHRCFLEVIS